MPTQTITADTHVHIYACHDGVKTIREGFSNLRNADSNAKERFLCLTERHDCHFFNRLANEDRKLLPGLTVEKTAEDFCLRITGPDHLKVYLLAGRQIVTAERLEILALGRDMELRDGKPIQEVIEAVRDAGALPIINWAPGKWFFGRGKIVEAIINDSKPDAFLLGDTSLRPVGWPTPILMRKAMKKGFGILAGSDPLPFPGEEKLTGTFGIKVDADFDPDRPGSSFLEALRNTKTNILHIGKRGGPAQVGLRLKKNQAVRTS